MSEFDIYEDGVRLKKKDEMPEFTSPYQDFRYYSSSVTPNIQLAMNVIKPVQPAHMLVKLHGWHMSMPQPQRRETPPETGGDYLLVQLDMRGRAFSEGKADCNGLELVDIHDAVQFVRKEYASHLVDPEVVYLEGGSGGGGNVLAAIGKFPDLFAAASSFYPMSDYATWYEQDLVGEFRDEMDVWIGCSPDFDPERYEARSGIHLLSNLQTPLYMAHGDGDIRVPVSHSRSYVEQAAKLGKSHLVRYDELKGVGGQKHQDGISDGQLASMNVASEVNRRQNAVPISIPEKGTLVVGGFLYTKHFQVELDSIQHVALLNYDLQEGTFQVTAQFPYGYSIHTIEGNLIVGTCIVTDRERGTDFIEA